MLGNHRIESVLGRGGMGVVYGAEDTLLGRPVAIKLLPGALATDPLLLDRFVQEARSAARLHHPNVVTIFEAGSHEGLTYLVMERVGGGSLAEAVGAGPLPWREATEVIAQACRGLASAHRAGLIHRDIKPANLLRAEDGSIKIADFGLAKLVDGFTQQITQTGRVLGTPAFMSPEQCQSDPVDHRTDLYSLGATYYALLSGQGPYADSTSAPKVMFAHCYKPVPDPREVVPAVPDGCAAVVSRAMAKAPADRYPDADAMRADLEALLAERTPSWATAPTVPVVPVAKADATLASPSGGSTGTAERWTRRGLLGLGASAAAAYALISIREDRASRRRFAEQVNHLEGPGPAASPAPIAPGGPPIRVGVLHSVSGTMATSESGVINGTLMAIEEVNAAGGVLGRPVEAVLGDGRSDPDAFAAEADRLISAEGVAALFGCWTSASRKAVRPVVEARKHLLLYPMQYEGLEDSPRIIYLGAAPNQQLIPAVRWAFTELGRRFFHVGSDYVFPRAAGAVMGDEIARLGGELAGQAFRPINATDFDGVVDQNPAVPARRDPEHDQRRRQPGLLPCPPRRRDWLGRDADDQLQHRRAGGPPAWPGGDGRRPGLLDLLHERRPARERGVRRPVPDPVRPAACDQRPDRGRLPRRPPLGLGGHRGRIGRALRRPGGPGRPLLRRPRRSGPGRSDEWTPVEDRESPGSTTPAGSRSSPAPGARSSRCPSRRRGLGSSGRPS